MTVGTKMHQTLASLEGAAANIKTFALDTQDKTAKDMFTNLSQQLDGINQQLRGRLNYIEEQEPQYKMQ
ncbi:MAG: DUF1657 domain-containing protein [Firmicutes bacterium]|nr:DUF1657 domain-containing protein [Bacillota bacterium]